MAQSKTHDLTERQLLEYRQWLKELDEEAHAPGGRLDEIDPALWSIFRPEGPIGKQIYRSYTDEELLEPLLRTMNHPGHKPRLDEVHIVWKEYLRLRFDTLGDACWKARSYRKRRMNEQAWPADWPERLTPERLLAYLGRRGYTVTEVDRQTVARYCLQLQRTKEPPAEGQLPSGLIQLFGRAGCQWRCGMQELNAPLLSKAALRHMRRYWAERRKEENPADASAAE